MRGINFKFKIHFACFLQDPVSTKIVPPTVDGRHRCRAVPVYLYGQNVSLAYTYNVPGSIDVVAREN